MKHTITFFISFFFSTYLSCNNDFRQFHNNVHIIQAASSLAADQSNYRHSRRSSYECNSYASTHDENIAENIVSNPELCWRWTQEQFITAMAYLFGKIKASADNSPCAGMWLVDSDDSYEFYVAENNMPKIMELWELYKYDNFWACIRRFPHYKDLIIKAAAKAESDKRIQRSLSLKTKKKLADEKKRVETLLAQEERDKKQREQIKAETEAFYKDVREAFDNNKQEFKEYLEAYDLLCEQGIDAALNKDNRIQKIAAAVQAIDKAGARYVNASYSVSTNVINELKNASYDSKLYQMCYGNQLQQVIHADCITLLKETASVPISSVLYDYKPTLIDCIDAAREYNQAGFCYKAINVTDFCWAMLDYGKAILEGAAWGIVGAAQDLIEHPLHTAACVVMPQGVFVYQLSKVLVNVIDIGITYLFDDREGNRKLKEYIAPIAALIGALNSKQLTGPEVVRGVTQFAFHWKAQNRFLSGLNKFYSTAKGKLEKFVNENPLASPEQYMTTPEGMMFRASSKLNSENNHVKDLKELSNSLSLANENVNQKVFEFTEAAARHMEEPERMIPLYILDGIIKKPIHVLKDPRKATEALMYYAQIWKNGKLYNVEVLYDHMANKILHFLYRKEALGPLPRIK